MSLLERILSRKSVRSYESKEIPEEVLRKILETGRKAPSAANRQPLRSVIVQDHEIKKNLINASFKGLIKEASFVIVGCANVDSLLTGKWAVIDTAIAM